MIVIYGIKQHLNPIKAALSDVLQASMTQVLGLPLYSDGKRGFLLSWWSK